MIRRRTLLALATLALTASTAAADMLQLWDGRMVDGPKMEVDGNFIVVHYENGDVRVPVRMVEDYLIEGAAAFEPKNDEERAKRAEGLVPFEGKWVTAQARAQAIAKAQKAKRAELEEYRQHTVWRNRYEFATKHFTFQSTLEPRKNDEFAELLEAYFKEFGKLWKVKVPKDWGKLEVYMHRDRESFMSRSGAPSGALAYYKFVAPRELHFFYDRRDPEGSVATMFHEANHYLADLISEEFQYPHWIGEGMAEYFSASVWDADRKKMIVGGVQPGRLVEVRKDIDGDKRYELTRLVGGDQGEYEHYYWGWSFIHFMLQSPKYAKNFTKYITDLADAKDIDRTRDGRNFKRVSGAECMKAFKKRMKVDDLGALEAEWYEYIDKLDNSDIRGLEQAGMRAFSEGRTKFRAPRLLKAAIDGGSTKSQVYIYYAMCQLIAKDGGAAQALEQYARACEIDPLDGWTWAYRGYHLKHAMKETAEGERLIALAKEMDPDEDYLDLEVAVKLAEVAREED